MGPVVVNAQDHFTHARVFPSDLKPTDNISTLIDAPTNSAISWGQELNHDKVILVRYLGYSCSHCVEQLTYLNSYSERLIPLGFKVIAISSDDDETIAQMMRKMGYNRDLIHVFSDKKDVFAKKIGAVRTISDTVFDLHSTIVINKGEIRFSNFGEAPYMDIEHLVAVGVAGEKPAVPQIALLEIKPSYFDRFFTKAVAISEIAGPGDGVNAPLDLDFNPSPLHPRDLWVVTTDTYGNGIAIVHEVGTTSQQVRLKKDSRASHFMWRTMALDMGENGSFATGQNGQEGGGFGTYMFMGPTLWSADTAIFASRFQGSNTVLASHLDMLHQSPQCLGIVHDTANVYWVVDGYYKDIVRYDFHDPHEIGGEDHRDGIIRRYTGLSIPPPARGMPSHIDLDRKTGWLYFIDPSKGSIHRLQTKSGTPGATLSMPPESAENIAEYIAVDNATVETVVETGLQSPVGMAVYEDRLLVSDRATGKIHVYAVNESPVVEIGAISTGATEILGITVGPDENIYYVDRANGTVNCIKSSQEPSLKSEARVRSANRTDSARFTYMNPSNSVKSAEFDVHIHRMGETVPSKSFSFGPISLNENAETEFSIPIELDSMSAPTVVSVQEKLQSSGIVGVGAQTVLVGKDLRRVLIDDATTETYNFAAAVAQTSRTGYVNIPVDIFVQVADSLMSLKTMVWNSGTFGEFNEVEDAIMSSVLERGVDVLLIGDDPFSLRTDLNNSAGFFNQFGVRFLGADVPPNDKGQRILDGVIADTITAGMNTIDCQLTRMDNPRGGKYNTNVTFELSRPNSSSILVVKNSTKKVAVKYDAPKYRSVILGLNVARFLDGVQRTQLLDKSIVWLEAAANPDPIDTTSTTNVLEFVENTGSFSISINANPVRTDGELTIRSDYSSKLLTVEMFTSTGQRVATIYNGTSMNTNVQVDFSRLAVGMYFIVARSADEVKHLSVSKQ